MASTTVRSNGGGGGIGFASLLCIVFIVLKLVGVINWSWLWVLAPFWIHISIWIVFIIGLALIDYLR